LVGSFGTLPVFNYDFLSQALSKLERGHTQDLWDVREMLRLGLISEADVLTQARALRPRLHRYSAIDADSFEQRVRNSSQSPAMPEPLPGGEILTEGLRDLDRGIRSVPALLVLIASPRLARSGIVMPPVTPSLRLPEHELYDLLVAAHGPEAYRMYRSLLRRLVNLENALDVSQPPSAH